MRCGRRVRDQAFDIADFRNGQIADFLFAYELKFRIAKAAKRNVSHANAAARLKGQVSNAAKECSITEYDWLP